MRLCTIMHLIAVAPINQSLRYDLLATLILHSDWLVVLRLLWTVLALLCCGCYGQYWLRFDQLEGCIQHLNRKWRLLNC